RCLFLARDKETGRSKGNRNQTSTGLCHMGPAKPKGVALRPTLPKGGCDDSPPSVFKPTSFARQQGKRAKDANVTDLLSEISVLREPPVNACLRSHTYRTKPFAQAAAIHPASWARRAAPRLLLPQRVPVAASLSKDPPCQSN